MIPQFMDFVAVYAASFTVIVPVGLAVLIYTRRVR